MKHTSSLPDIYIVLFAFEVSIYFWISSKMCIFIVVLCLNALKHSRESRDCTLSTKQKLQSKGGETTLHFLALEKEMHIFA